MAKHIFPSENAIGSLFSSPTRDARERAMAEWMKVLSACKLDAFVYSGFTISDPNSGLVATVAAGVACINGYRIENDASENIINLADTRPADAPNFIWATLDKDGNGLVTGYTLVSNTTGTPPTDSVLLGFAVTSGGQVTGVTTYAARPTTVKGSYTGDGTTDRFIFTGQFTPSYIIVYANPYVRNNIGDPVGDAFVFSPVVTGGKGFATLYSLFADPDNDIPLGSLTTTSNAERPTPTTNGFTVSAEVAGTFRQSLNTTGDAYSWIAWV